MRSHRTSISLRAAMNRKHQLIVIGLTVLTLCSVVSHLVARGLHLRTQAVSPLFFGDTNQQDTATVAGSSLTFYGIEWHAVAQRLKAGMTGLGVPAGSVHELEILQRKAPPVRYTFLGVSMFDLNENYLSDFRADIVPMGEAIKSLRESHSSWAYRKRVLSQYPMKYIRSLFPTAGRSVTVMVGVREKLRAWLNGGGRRPKRSWNWLWFPARAILIKTASRPGLRIGGCETSWICVPMRAAIWNSKGRSGIRC